MVLRVDKDKGYIDLSKRCDDAAAAAVAAAAAAAAAGAAAAAKLATAATGAAWTVQRLPGQRQQLSWQQRLLGQHGRCNSHSSSSSGSTGCRGSMDRGHSSTAVLADVREAAAVDSRNSRMDAAASR
jgi:hypothetical protein